METILLIVVVTLLLTFIFAPLILFILLVKLGQERGTKHSKLFEFFFRET